MSDPRTMFPQFHDSSAIQLLGRASRWTISGRLEIPDPASQDSGSKRKAPIDVRHLLDGCNAGCQHTGPLRGAWATDERCLVTLEELVQRVPDAANNAFYLKAMTDGLMVIDIEPDCPPDVAAELLSLPEHEVLYRELSMSGRGFHLLTPLPDNFHDHPLAAEKIVLRHEQGWYEILLKHWATFTRRPIPQDHPVLRAASEVERPRFGSIAELYEDLAVRARESSLATSGDVRTAAEMPDIPGSQQIVDEIVAMGISGVRPQTDFDGDTSRWEFSVLGRLYGLMQSAIGQQSMFHQHVYTPADQAWLLYGAALQIIPARSKHNERRNNRPFLLDRAAALVAERQAQVQRELNEQGYRGPAF